MFQHPEADDFSLDWIRLVSKARAKIFSRGGKGDRAAVGTNIGQQFTIMNDSYRHKEFNSMRITKSQLRRLISETLEDTLPPGRQSDAYRAARITADIGAPSPLENLASDILDTINNAVGQVDLDFSDEPMTKKDIIEFVIKMLIEEEPQAMIAGKVDPSWARRKYAGELDPKADF